MNCERLRKTATRHVEIHNYLVGWFRPRTLLDVQNLHDEQMVVVSVYVTKGVSFPPSRVNVQRGLLMVAFVPIHAPVMSGAALWAAPDMFSICVKAEVVKWRKT